MKRHPRGIEVAAGKRMAIVEDVLPLAIAVEARRSTVRVRCNARKTADDDIDG